VPRDPPAAVSAELDHLKLDCLKERAGILELSGHVQMLRDCPLPPFPGSGEFRANITLAFRHLEDARMRLGKAIQAIDGGVSCYDK